MRDPLGDLVARYARTHGPFDAGDVAARFGLGPAVVEQALARLAGTGRVVAGEFLPGGAGAEWCDAEVLRMLRRRSLAALRKEVEPVPVEALAAFLPALAAGRQPAARRRRRAAGRRAAAGRAVPASALESLVLPARVPDYSPAHARRAVRRRRGALGGHGSLPGGDGWVSLHLADTAHLTAARARPGRDQHARCTRRSLDALAGGGAFFFRQLADVVGREAPTDDDRRWSPRCGTWSGRATSATTPSPRCAPWSRAAAARTRPAGRRRAAATAAAARRCPAAPARRPPPAAGRCCPSVEPDPTRRARALAEVLLDRHGVVTRGAVVAERAPGGFAAVYRVLAAFEETGRCRRGYFVEGLGAAQFALPGRGRPAARGRRPRSSAPARARGRRGADVPARAGARRDRPGQPVRRGAAVARRAARTPGTSRAARPARWSCWSTARLVLYVERGGRTLLTWADEPGLLQPAVDALALAVREGQLGRLTVERADGAGVLDSPLGRALEEAGFHATPRGLRLRG